MKVNHTLFKYFALVIACLTMLGCKKDEFDGLLNVDPAPSTAVTFPQSVGANGYAQLDQNAYIIFQNAVSSGQISVDVQVPEGKQITGISVAAQRFRAGATTSPNISPTLPTGTTDEDRQRRAPSAVISRTTAPNIANNVPVTPGSTVTFSIPANAIPAAISNTTLINGQAGTPLGPLQVNDVVRMFFRVHLADGTVQRAVEVRIVVTG